MCRVAWPIFSATRIERSNALIQESTSCRADWMSPWLALHLPGEDRKRQNRLKAHELIHPKRRPIEPADDQGKRFESELGQPRQTKAYKQAAEALTLIFRKHRHLRQMSLASR